MAQGSEVVLMMILALERAAAFVHRGLRIAQERVVIELDCFGPDGRAVKISFGG